MPNKKITLSVSGVILTVASAQAASVPSDAKEGPFNVTLFCLVSLMIILLFIIGVLGHTLRSLSPVIHEKIQKEKETSGSGKTVVTIAALLFAVLLPGYASAADGPIYFKDLKPVDGIPAVEFYTLISVIGLELIVIFFMAIYMKIMLKVIQGTVEQPDAKATVVVERSWFWDKFNKAAKVEDEKEILLDHNYDGIQELDNSLPPWWKYGFYLTIVVSFIYIYRYHFSHDGLSQEEEFVAEMQQGEADKAAYLAKSANNVDETNVKLLTDAGAVAAGKEMFQKNCAACHVADGGGSVGPNLTDEYWLHGGSVKDVFKSIKYGWQDKGMKSWKDDLSPSQMQQVASFIKSLKGTHPAAPKAPQGDLYIEATGTAAAKMDTTSAAGK